MAVDPAIYIGTLDANLPLGSEAASELDNNFRHIKGVLKTNLPNITGVMSASHTELNYVAGVTSAIQTQIDAKGAIAGQTWTGTHSFTGAVVSVATPTTALHAVTKAYADGLAFATALPAISAATSAKVISNDGTTAAWADTPMVTAESMFMASF